MSYSNGDQHILKDIQQTAKKVYMLKYRDKTNEELEAILKHNAQAIHGQSLAEGYETLGESDACRQIINNRATEKLARASHQLAEEKAFQQAFTQWNNDLNSRRMNAIINLPTAVGYHGQLVAAILSEEDGLSAQEICQWSEELAALSNHDMQTLLTALVSEGILTTDGQNNYHLISVCNETLLPVNVVYWAKNIFRTKHNRTLSSEQEDFLGALAVSSTPLSEYDWFKITGNTKALKEAQEGKKIWSSSISKLTQLVDCGILMRTPIKETKLNLYYMPMLGEGK